MKKIFALAALLLFIPVAFAGDFSVSTSVTEQTVCATDTILYVLTIQNIDKSAGSYTVSVSGEAAKWAVAAPAGFTLSPQETGQIYVYVTPVSGAHPGTYSLQIKVNGQETLLKIDVGDCHSAAFTAEQTTQEICADTTTEYFLTLSNTGKYTETFAVTLSGTAANWATLSDTVVKLNAGGTKQIKVTATPPAVQTGLFDLTVNAKAGNSNAAASLQLGLRSNNCYEFELKPDKNYFSFCENSEVKIPLTVENKGNVDNIYTITAAGPRWISVEQKTLNVPAGASRTTNLVLFPDYGVSGDFKIIVKANSERGELVSEQVITANVLTCHSTDLKISVAEDTLCPFTSKAYEVSLKNTGTFDERYAVTLTGADFAVLDKSFVDIQAGKIDSINLLVDTKDYPAGDYLINVKAEAQDPAHAKASDTLKIRIAPKEDCFGVLTTAALTRIRTAPGEGTLVPVIIENKGTEESTFNLEISGTGAAYAKLNPAVVTIEGRRAKTAYIYIAVPEETARKEYMLTVSARLEDGTVSSSSNVVLEVVAPAAVTGVTPTQKEKIQTTTAPLQEKLSSARNWVLAVFGKAENFAKAKIVQIKEFFSREAKEEPKVEVKEEPEVEAEEELQPEIEEITEEVIPEEIAPELEEKSEWQYLSEEARKKLEAITGTSEEEPETKVISAEGTVERLISKIRTAGVIGTLQAVKGKVRGIELPGEREISGSSVERIKANANRVLNFSGATGDLFSKAKTFLFSPTYRLPNWLWLAGIIIVLAVISYMLREEEPKEEGKKKKGLWQKFMDWLEEEDETKPAEQTAVEPPKGPRAQDILKEVEKEQQEKKEKKPAPRKRGRPKKK